MAKSKANPNFIYAPELKKLYQVIGSYYILEYNNGVVLSCRNCLEMYSINYAERPQMQPDALVIMMNPGASHPVDKLYIPPTFKSRDVIEGKGVDHVWVSAVPDITQYQIQRVMLHKGWRYVRILNLSDIRCPDSLMFNLILGASSEIDGDRVHSVFSKHRTKECTYAMSTKETAPIILAWGCDKVLLELAELGMEHIPVDRRVGVPCGDDGLLYYHASPRNPGGGPKWLKDIKILLA